MAVLAVDFIDELSAGLPVSDAPSVRSEFGLDYGETTWFLLAAPLLASVVIEPPLMVLSDRWPRRRMVLYALGTMALALCAAALAPSAWTFVGAFAIWAAAGGVGVGVAQASLMAAFPDQRERMMARWTLMGTLGDACVPLLLFAAGVSGGSWRTALLFAAGLHALELVVLALLWNPDLAASLENTDEPKDEASVSARLLEGLRNRPLLLWLGVAASCSLLDETFVVFATLRMRDAFGASLFEQTALVFADAVGCAVGLLLADHLLPRVAPRRLLIGSALLCAAAYLGWLLAPTSAVAIASIFFVGLLFAPLYPLAQARAYAACPTRPGVTRAIDSLYLPLSVFAPLALGWIADAFSLAAALGVLLLQPLGVAAIALATRPARRREPHRDQKGSGLPRP